MPSATLAIGSAGYNLLEALEDGDGTAKEDIKVSRSGSSYSIRSKNGEDIENLAIGSQNLPSTIIDASSNVSIFTGLLDFEASLGKGGDTLSIFGNVEGGRFELDSHEHRNDQLNATLNGRDLLSIRGDLTRGRDSRTEVNRIYSGGNEDTVRITGKVEDAFIFLGSGNDSLSIGGNSFNLDVKGDAGKGDAGNDYIEFRGDAGKLSGGGVRVQGGEGSDTVIFRNVFQGSSAEKNPSFGDYDYDDNTVISDPGTSAVDLGEGNDSLVLGKGATNVDVNTGSGKDTVSLNGSFENVQFHLDGANWNYSDDLRAGDRIAASNGAIFANSTFSSNSNAGDSLIFGSNTTFDGTKVYLSNNEFFDQQGAGRDSLVFGSNSYFLDSTISTGYGSDTIVFGSSSTFGNLAINLGNNDGDGDQIRFAAGTNFENVSIYGAGSGDTLFIGSTAYYYDDLQDNFYSNGGQLWKPA
jgi:hypothetical protein